eukprot:155350-Amphidinium_carterae.1
MKNNRWLKTKNNVHRKGRRYTEQMCKNCVSVNWENKTHCRRCGGSLSDCMRVTPGHWPPDNWNPEMLRLCDHSEPQQPASLSAQKATARPRRWRCTLQSCRRARPLGSTRRSA